VKKIIFTFMILFIVGCSNKEIPAWKSYSYDYLENYKSNYLLGNQFSNDYLIKSINEAKNSGDLDTISKIYLTRYALEVALLEESNTTDIENIRKVEPNIQSEAYYRFLNGDLVDIEELISSKYRDFVMALKTKDLSRILNTIHKSDDDLTKLIMIGVAYKYGIKEKEILYTGFEISSKNGWKKAVVNYMSKLSQFDTKIKNKIEFLKEH